MSQETYIVRLTDANPGHAVPAARRLAYVVKRLLRQHGLRTTEPVEVEHGQPTEQQRQIAECLMATQKEQ